MAFQKKNTNKTKVKKADSVDSLQTPAPSAQPQPNQEDGEKTPVPTANEVSSPNSNDYPFLSSTPTMDIGNGVLLDFNHGFRVTMPSESKNYFLHVIDADTQTVIANMDVPGGARAVGDRKYFIRYHVEVVEKETNRLIAVHDYNCEGKRVMIIVPDSDFGNELAWIPYAEEFRKKYRAKVTCACSDLFAQIVRDQYPELDFVPVSNIPDSRNFYATYFCGIFPADRNMWRPSAHQVFGVQGSIARILGVDSVPCKVRFPYYAERPVTEPYICISTLANSPMKLWNNTDGWNTLCRYLKKLGYRVFDIDSAREIMFGNTVYSTPVEAEDCTGVRPLAERIAMLQHAEFFVGVSSGLSWLAWNCNIPVVLISGFSLDGAEFPTPYRVFNQNFCHGCWNDSNLFFDDQASVWCPHNAGTPRELECTRVITPKMVIDAVNRIPSVRSRLRPLVTFALPVHNPHPGLFSDMLQSVINCAKAYGNAEIRICDDASTEPTAKVLIEECRHRNPGFVFVEYADKSEGRDACLRKLLVSAKGRYFIPFEQNALMLPFDLQRIVREMEERPEIVCNYAKKCFFGDNGPEGVPHGAPFSAFQSIYSPMQVQDAAVFRTDPLLKSNAWETGTDGEGYSLFCALAPYGTCAYTPEVRTLALRNDQSNAISTENFNASLRNFLAAYQETVSQLEQGIFPENRDGIPLAAIAGVLFFLRKNDKDFAVKLLTAARERFPEDPGVRMSYLQHLVTQADPSAFKEEWDSIIHTFLDEETQYRILASAITLAAERGIFSEKQLNILKNMGERWKKIPGAAIDAWNNVLSPKKGVFATQLKPIKVSVIIPVTRGRYIADCVHSVVDAFAAYDQTEILIHNDASTEPSLDIRLQILQAEYPDRIRIFRGKVNLGAAMARAELIRHSRGEYIVCFDDDDIMLPFDVKKVVDFLDANPQYCVSYAPKYLFNEKGYMNEIHGNEFSYFQSFFAPKININAAFLRKSDLLDAGGFQNIRGDKRAIGEDTYLLIRMSQKKDVWLDPEPRALYRIHNSQVTHDNMKWEKWITEQPCIQHPDLVKRIINGDFPDTNGPDFRLVRGLMGAVMFLYQQDLSFIESIVKTAVERFPDDPGVPEARLRLYLASNKIDEILAYYPKVLEQFKDTIRPRLTILELVFSAMQKAKMPIPLELSQLYAKLYQEYYKLSPAAVATFKKMGMM